MALLKLFKNYLFYGSFLALIMFAVSYQLMLSFHSSEYVWQINQNVDVHTDTFLTGVTWVLIPYFVWWFISLFNGCKEERFAIHSAHTAAMLFLLAILMLMISQPPIGTTIAVSIMIILFGILFLFLAMYVWSDTDHYIPNLTKLGLILGNTILIMVGMLAIALSIH